MGEYAVNDGNRLRASGQSPGDLPLNWLFPISEWVGSSLLALIDFLFNMGASRALYFHPAILNLISPDSLLPDTRIFCLFALRNCRFA
jgi:hypothetical protein